MTAAAHDVIVVGAGPTGLLVAGELARRGLDVVLWESRPDAGAGSRAIGIHAPVLAALEESGTTERLLGTATRVTAGVARAAGRRIGEVHFDRLRTRFPFVATVPQALTEQALAAAAPPVRRGTTAMRVHDRGDRVEVEADDGGSATTVTARLVVLATGAAGRALAPADLAVRTHRYPDRYLMADVDDPSGALADTAVITLDPAGVVESFPLPGGRRRLVAWVTPDVTAPGVTRDVAEPGTVAPEGAAEAARLREAVVSRTGQVRLAERIEGAQVSSFGIRRSLAARLRTGRVFAVGDAVHEVSPIGGQGMNLGLLDAVTLAPLLAEWLFREEPVTALGRWERDRLASARVAARLAGVNTAMGRPRGPLAQAVTMRALTVALSGPLSGLPTRAYAMELDRAARLRRSTSR